MAPQTVIRRDTQSVLARAIERVTGDHFFGDQKCPEKKSLLSANRTFLPHVRRQR